MVTSLFNFQSLLSNPNNIQYIVESGERGTTSRTSSASEENNAEPKGTDLSILGQIRL